MSSQPGTRRRSSRIIESRRKVLRDAIREIVHEYKRAERRQRWRDAIWDIIQQKRSKQARLKCMVRKIAEQRRAQKAAELRARIREGQEDRRCFICLQYDLPETCDFLNDVTDACILVAAMKHFGMTSMDDSPTDNKPPPPTATRAVKMHSGTDTGPDNTHQISPEVITRANLVFTPSGANIHVSASKTIQCHQRALVLPIPSSPGSRLCPISALRRTILLVNGEPFGSERVNPGPSSAPLFSVLSGSALEPITYKHFSGFLSRVASRLHLDPSRFSPHTFRRGGATFAFDCHVSSKIIKLQGDWQSDAYLVYLELSQQQKQRACQAMAAKLQSVSGVILINLFYPRIF
ncbi:uncharacterized protein LOC141861550 [Acropora palmata]|uniref:uncharacterized protein LOC141861550 n=1 Tax=Acropora palmata TaxID=6131 RepID=UPI003DA1C14D